MLACISNNPATPVMSDDKEERRGHTRVVCSTFVRRGKSLVPESRIAMLESSSCIDDCSDETHEASGDETDIGATDRSKDLEMIQTPLRRACCVNGSPDT